MQSNLSHTSLQTNRLLINQMHRPPINTIPIILWKHRQLWFANRHTTPDTYQPKTSRTPLNFEHSYNTTSALCKAVSRARKALPTSPSKRKAVIAKLIYALDEQSQIEIFSNKATTIKRTGHYRIQPTLVEQIYKLYERDDISQVSTDKGDLMTFVNPFTGDRQLTVRRYLMHTLRHVFDLFMKENAGE